ncbi:MAG: alpha/beta hydrolase [Acidimicrobiia bacterium]|nr:alpha/beta hydrolase [Acidimicrobiia bacterium]
MSAPGQISEGHAETEALAEHTRWHTFFRWYLRIGLVVVGLSVVLIVLVIVGRILIGHVEPEPYRAAVALLDADTSILTTSSGETHVLDVGDGDVVLLIHGSAGSLADWQETVVDRLAESHRVVAFDSFGFGLSERNDSFDYGFPLWTRQAVEVLDALGIDRAVVVGHSAGGLAAVMLAAEHPDRFRGVVITGHGISFDTSQLIPLIPGIGEVWAAQQPVIGNTFSEDYRRRAEEIHRIRGTRRAYLAFVRSQYRLASLDYVNLYEQIQIPVLQLHGDSDTAIPIEAARDISSRITDSRFVAIPASDHHVHIDAPDRWTEEVTNFAASLPD